MNAEQHIETTTTAAVVTLLAKFDRHIAAVMELWRDVYGAEFGWLDAQVDPRSDGFHERSTYYVSLIDGAYPVGTMRIVDALPSGFHITDAVEVAMLSARQPKVVEVQRLMVRPEFRDKRLPGAPFGIYGCMVKACLHHAIAHGVDTILADCHRDIKISPLKSMKTMGFKETGETYIDSMNGLVCTILTIDTKTWLRNIYGDQNAFNRYLLDVGEWTVLSDQRPTSVQSDRAQPEEQVYA